MPDILMISSGLFHPPLLGRVALWSALSALPDYCLRHASSLAALLNGSRLPVDAVVLYFHRQRISVAALAALDHFVTDGGGVLAVHSATASFKETPRYGEVLGGRFKGHPPLGPVRVRQIPGEDEIFGAVPPFDLQDEAYLHELSDDIRVHFTAAPLPNGAALPFVWTRRHGRGRVCYVGAGHVAGSLRHRSMVRILHAGLAWVCDPDVEILQ